MAKLITEERETIDRVHARVEKQEGAIIKSAIESVLHDQITAALNFGEALARSVAEAHSLVDHLRDERQKTKDIIRMQNAELVKKIRFMVAADTGVIVDRIMDTSEQAWREIKQLDQEAETYNQVRPLAADFTVETAYDTLGETMEQDAYYWEKYLVGTVYRSRKDFFMSESTLMDSTYPIESWYFRLQSVSKKIRELE